MPSSVRLLYYEGGVNKAAISGDTDYVFKTLTVTSNGNSPSSTTTISEVEGNFDFAGKKLVNLSDPTDETDSATKSYVDHHHSFIDYEFTSATGGQTTFECSGGITSTQIVDVWVEGVLRRENSVWTRDTQTGSVVFSEAIQEDYWVKIRVHFL